MVYIKSIIDGLLAVLLAAAFFSAIAFVTVVIIGRLALGGIAGIGVDFPRGPGIVSFFLLLAIAIFGAEFFWEFHKLTK